MNGRQIEEAEVIQAGDTGNDGPESAPAVKFLVFLIDNRKYALYVAQVREILMDNPLFFVPFVPAYVRGFINRHGEPYTVIDINALLGNPVINSVIYLILNKRDDQVAFIISAILEIREVPENRVRPVSSAELPEPVFSGAFTAGEQEILILNPDSIIARLESDIEATG